VSHGIGGRTTANEPYERQSVLVYQGLDPFLTASRQQLSVSAGGVVTFDLDFPDEEAGVPYALLASLAEDGFWAAPRGGCMPIGIDSLTMRMKGSPPALFRAPRGFLGPGGVARAAAVVQPGALRSYAGMRVRFVAVTHAPGQRLRASSVAVAVDLLP